MPGEQDGEETIDDGGQQDQVAFQFVECGNIGIDAAGCTACSCEIGFEVCGVNVS